MMLVLVVTVLVTAGLPLAQTRTPAERAFDEAVYVERVEGDLNRALEMFRNIAKQFADDPVAVRAQQRLSEAAQSTTTAAAPLPRTVTGRGIYVARFDPKTGRVVGPGMPLAGSSPDGSCAPAWSPDGRAIAFKRPGGPDPDGRQPMAWVVRSLATGTEKTSITSTTSSFAAGACVVAPVWYHDNKTLLNGSFLQRNDRLSRLDVDTMRVTAIDVLQPRDVAQGRPAIALAPNDRSIYMAAHDQEQQRISIAAVDLVSGARTPIWASPMTVDATLPSPLRLALSPDAKRFALVVFNLRNPSSPLDLKRIMGLAFADKFADAGKELDANAQSHLVRVGTDGKDSQLLYSAAEGSSLSRSGLAWTKDGRSILFVIHGPTGPRLMRIPAEGGVPEFTGLTIGNADAMFDLHPDGRIAFFAGSFSIADHR
jgi:hypothetical protein